MDFNATIDLIIKDLDEAREIIDDLKKYPGVPALQIELAKSKCKSAGEIIAFLKSYRDTGPVVVTPTPTPAPAPVTITPPVAITPRVEITPAPDTIVSPVTITPSPAAIIPPADRIPVPAERKGDSKKIPEEVSETPIIADRFNSPASLNEQLGENKSDEEVTVFLKTKPLTNLSEAIGVNDKFLYIREIFDGNKAAYSQAISRLDNVKNLSDAREIILSYKGDIVENEAVKQLLNLVKRKFPLNE
jgi:hypothetical protein